jgi:hypothetical protein
VVIEGVFESDPAGGVIFHDATGIDDNAIAEVPKTSSARSRGSEGILGGDADRLLLGRSLPFLSGASRSNFSGGPVASTRDTLPRCALRGVGFPIL